jgi:hypothetical protein
MGNKVYAPMRILGYVVLLAMLAAVVYTACITLTHWAGIGV